MFLKNMPSKRIGEILIEEGFLEAANLKKALEIQKIEGGLVGHILLREGWVKEEELIMGLSKQLSLPFIELRHYNINRKALKHVTKEIAQRYLLFPFEEEGRELSLATADPLNPEAVQELEKMASLTLHVFLAAPSDIKRAINNYYAEDKTCV